MLSEPDKWLFGAHLFVQVTDQQYQFYLMC
jgi:hypothetical protein